MANVLPQGKTVEQAINQQNPAEAKSKRSMKRIPMSVPRPKLAVPEMPGYFLYWHLGKNVPAAIQAGYSFVEEDEVELEELGVANDVAGNGNSDMGTRISRSAGDNGDKDPERLYLMKLPIELRREDEAALAEVNESIAAAIRGGAVGATPAEVADQRRYMKDGQDLFWPKNRGKRPG